MTLVTLWIALNLLVLAYLWMSQDSRRRSVKRESGGSTTGRPPVALERNTTEALVRQLRRDLENHGPDWFKENEKTRHISRRDEREG